jgi:hypothetical protein
VTTGAGTLELCLPEAVRRAPALAIVSAEAADPGSDRPGERVGPAFGPELLGGEAE